MHDIAIIGAGPAGASAALFAAKAGKKTLVLDDDRSITKRARVRNHYGLLDITGPDLLELGKQQAVAFGAEVHRGTVTSIARNEGGFRIESANGTYEARHVVLATGLVVDVAENLGVVTKPGTEPRIKVVLEVDSAGRTNIPGVWAAGTVAGASVHTIVTAGDGAKVAINIISELNGTRWVDHEVLKP
jgi:thioredoxin reductase (NADPH)